MLSRIVRCALVCVIVVVCSQGCATSPEEHAKKLCNKINTCFPKSNYGACVVSSVKANEALPEDQRQADWFEADHMANMTCNDLEVEFYKLGIDLSGLK